MRVLKFGGTSVATPERRAGIATLVARSANEGPTVVVTSALAGTTDRLHDLIDEAVAGGRAPMAALERLRRAHQDHPAIGPCLDTLGQRLAGIAQLGECGPRTRCRILATGERLALPLLADALRDAGLEVRTVDGREVIAVEADATDSPPRIDWSATRSRARRHLSADHRGQVFLVPGFIAGDAEGRTRTLGRGASDLSATVLARVLDAQAVEIWSDVEGVMSADPRAVASASTLRRLSYRTAATLARFGAKVLHPEAVAPLASAGIPASIRCTLRPEDPGTLVSGACGTPTARLCAVTSRRGLSRLTLRPADRGAAAARARAVLAAVDVAPVAIDTDERRSDLYVDRAQAATAQRAVQRGLGAEGLVIGCHEGVAAVAVVCENGEPGLQDLGRLIAALDVAGIAPRAVVRPPAPYGNALVALVDDGQAAHAAHSLHRILVEPMDGHDAIARVAS